LYPVLFVKIKRRTAPAIFVVVVVVVVVVVYNIKYYK
jgi:hypothetical protein